MNQKHILIIVAIIIAIAGSAFWIVNISQKEPEGGPSASEPDPRKFRDAQRQVDILQFGVSLELYYIEQSIPQYPSAISSLSPKYLAVTRKDPLSGADYPYSVTGNPPQSYCLYAVMEDDTQGSFYKSPHKEPPQGFDNGQIKTDCDPRT